MPPFLIVLLVAGLVYVHLHRPFGDSIVALLATTFFVPAAIVVPSAPNDVWVGRIGLVSAVVGMLLRAGRHEIDRCALRASRPIVALGAFVVVAYLTGVLASPLPANEPSQLRLWVLLVEQLGFLWVMTVAVRVQGVRWVALATAGCVTAVAALGIGERLVGDSYARWWYRHQPFPNSVPAQPLEERGSGTRIRAAAEFSLQYAWVLTYFVPLVLILAVRTRRMVALLAPGAVAVALVLTVTRSSYAGLGAAAVLLLLAAGGDRRVIGAIVGAGLVAAFLFFGSSVVRDPYSGAAPDSVDSRERRLELVTQQLTTDPLFGIGIDGLVRQQIDSTDTSYLAVYAATGVVGLAFLVAALGTALATAASATFRVEEDTTVLAAAVLAGLVCGAIAAFAFDSLSGPFSSWSLWILAALATGLAEHALRGSPQSRPSPSPWRLAAVPAGLALGLMIAAAVPEHSAVRLRLFALNPGYASSESIRDDFVGEVILESTCSSAEAALPDVVSMDCGNSLQLGAGVAAVRLEAPDRATLDVALTRFEQVVADVHPATIVAVVEGPTTGTPTGARTAPVWATILAALAVCLTPPLRLRPMDVPPRVRATEEGPPEAGAEGPPEEQAWFVPDRRISLRRLPSD